MNPDRLSVSSQFAEEDDIRLRLAQACRTLERFVQTQPGWALGLSLGMGVLLGWWIKRR
jgi:ElaB/YqjD/DUF883 family membrane-anchored ribosome-binding protein